MAAFDEPLVLLSGMNCSARMWRPVVDQLGAVDLSPLTLEPAAGSIGGCVADLLAAAPPRFALAGLSLGGIVAMAALRTAPERVTRLALLDTTAQPPTPQQQAEWAGLRVALAGGATARDVQSGLLPALLSARGRSAGLAEEVLSLADETGRVRLDAQLSAQQTRVDERPCLPRVGVPTLVLVGAADALCGVDKHEEMGALVPGSRLVVLPGVGHLSPLEAPREVAQLLREWLG